MKGKYGFCILVICCLVALLFSSQSSYGKDVVCCVVPCHSSYLVVSKVDSGDDGVVHFYVDNATLAYQPPNRLPSPLPKRLPPPRPLPPPRLINPWR